MTCLTAPLPMLALTLIVVAAGPGPAQAEDAAPLECKTLTTGDTFCKVPREGGKGFRWVLQGKLRAQYEPGDDFPVYEHSMLMDLRRYDLPPVDGPWRYYKIAGVIYKVSSQTHQVIEVVGRAYGP